MQMKLVIILVMLLTMSSCDRSASSSHGTGEDSCIINDANWHRKEVSPPNRVLVWRIVVRRSELRVNGAEATEESLLDTLAKARRLRPSPYIILSREPSASCDALKALASKMEDVFDCNTNYCFYS